VVEPAYKSWFGFLLFIITAAKSQDVTIIASYWLGADSELVDFGGESLPFFSNDVESFDTCHTLSTDTSTDNIGIVSDDSDTVHPSTLLHLRFFFDCGSFEVDKHSASRRIGQAW